MLTPDSMDFKVIVFLDVTRTALLTLTATTRDGNKTHMDVYALAKSAVS